jgi:acid phosphatase family membrane protein YuiD
MMWPGQWPIWAVVLACGGAAQVVKVAAYSVANRRLALTVLGQSHGLPSLRSAVLACLLVRTALATGWRSGETGFAFVFAVIVVHDTVKLRLATSRQREALQSLVAALPGAGPVHQTVSEYLDPRVHHPSHVAVGAVFGALFALAFGMGPG